jgi:hypothetical protein
MPNSGWRINEYKRKTAGRNKEEAQSIGEAMHRYDLTA